MEMGRQEGFPGATGTRSTDELGEKASELGHGARRRAMEKLDENREQVCSMLDRVADTMQDDRLGGYAAPWARRGAEYLRARSAEDLLSSAREGLRAKPAVVLSACFVAGLAFARMVRR